MNRVYASQHLTTPNKKAARFRRQLRVVAFATAPVSPSALRKGRSVFYNDLTFPEPEDVLFTWGFPW